MYSKRTIHLPNVDLSDPYDIYVQFVTDEIIDGIDEETNRYAKQYIQTHKTHVVHYCVNGQAQTGKRWGSFLRYSWSWA